MPASSTFTNYDLCFVKSRRRGLLKPCGRTPGPNAPGTSHPRRSGTRPKKFGRPLALRRYGPPVILAPPSPLGGDMTLAARGHPGLLSHVFGVI
jgi:hypothetical protein